MSESRLADNLVKLRSRIAAAANRSGRSEQEITLVAVTKSAGVDLARQLTMLGCRNLGESRPQELWAKADALRDAAVRWHLIGHLQRNKAQRTVPLVSMIHAGDSLRLLESVNKSVATIPRRIPVLIEVNISGDAAKHGFAPAEVEANLAAIAALPGIEVRGLMTMAGRDEDIVQAQHEFAELRELRDRLQTVAPPNIKLDELSMGMSGDFEAAIAEGATMVRIGSALFEGIQTGQ